MELEEIKRKLKKAICLKQDKSKLTDLELQKEIKYYHLATAKKRNSIPYQEIIIYCIKESISLDCIFSDKQFELLVNL